MLKEKKISRYLLYALGEIILVVIGILIALQLNTWREHQKTKAKERILLLELKENLKESLVELEDVKSYNLKTIASNTLISNALIKKLPYSKSMDSAFYKIRYWASPYLTYTAYETIKNVGIDIISDAKLRKSIVNLYESKYENLIKDYDGAEWILAESVTYPLTTKYVRKDLNAQTSRPNDYETLKTNDEFINMLHEIIHMRRSGIKDITSTMRETQKVIDLINKEINNFD